MKKFFTKLNSIKTLMLLSICFLAGPRLFGQTYCSPSFNNGCSFSNNLTNVTMGYINNTTSGCSVSDYTNLIDTLIPGVPRPMSISGDGWTGPGVYIDLDNNGDFNGNNEFFYGIYPNTATYTENLTITIPIGTAPGPHRMRCIATWGYTPAAGDACITTVSYGNYEDYTVFVADTSCPTISVQPQSQIACNGTNITLSVASSTGYNWTYQWYKDGNPISGGTNNTYTINGVTPNDGGDYYATVTDGCVVAPTATSNTATLTYQDLPVATATPAGSTIFCPGNGVILNAGAGNGYTYQWLFNGNVITGATGAAYNATDTGLYTVAVFDGCHDTSSAVSTSFYHVPAPSLTPSGLVKLCVGQTLLLTDSSVSGETYQWQKDGQSLNGATNITYTATTPGFYSIVATNLHNCSTTSVATEVQINNPPVVNAAPNGNTTLLCQGAMMQLNASSSDTGETYQWQMNGVDIPGATGATYMASSAANYSVVGFDGCYVTSSAVTLTSNPFPDVIASGPTSFCAGNSVSLQSSITTTNNTSYQWMKDGAIIPGAVATTYTANASGSYAILVTSNNTCTALSTPMSITAYPLPQPAITASPTHELFTTIPYSSYQWYDLSGTNITPIVGANNYAYTATENGKYYVTVTDDYGCTAQSAGFTISDIVHLGVNNLNQISAAIKTYPNPATTSVHIESPVKVNAYISSIDGRVVLQQNNAVNIDITGLADGIYTLRITDATGNQLKIEKLVKQAR